MAKINTKPFDQMKLKKELKKRGVTLQDASVELGHSRTYLNNAKLCGEIAQHAIIGLEKLYRITYEDIAPDKAPDVMVGGVKQPFVDDGVPWLKLEYHISRAVAKGIKDSNLAEEIYQAIIKGFE